MLLSSIMDVIKKLDECEARFKEVSELVMDPALVKDAKKYKDTMREHGYLTELCALYDEYKKVLTGIQDAKEMITNLTLQYNTIRQSAITTELNEIISGAEAI